MVKRRSTAAYWGKRAVSHEETEDIMTTGGGQNHFPFLAENNRDGQNRKNYVRKNPGLSEKLGGAEKPQRGAKGKL